MIQLLKRKGLFLLVALTCFWQSLTSCSCFPHIDDFCGIVTESNYVVLAEIIDSISFETREVRLIENLNLEIERDTFVLLGQDGLNCGEWLELFSIGDTLVLALEQEADSLYYIEGFCGRHYLDYSGGNLDGEIYPNEETMSFQMFKQNLQECLDHLTGISEFEQNNRLLSAYPNPVSGNLQLRLVDGLIDEFELFSISGECIIRKTDIKNPGFTYDFSSHGSGAYFLRVRVDGQFIIRKILVNH